ncbi:uncharacterized protein PAN0_003d1459 [Moesziomyces antarcticus]|uniref:Uncharacterized protein n=1 Tax=Pseudozyma antarctica TaxID=84753 RepID=A0A5C3FJL7_PSEA2|nr:uncharacterized protein PAN0_003d1459 [Moesziomyces antarcticus]GAK63255.1 hypothetical protein PAN0_003d1459 [Moesziomyces antarcticus]SPO43837.1 uncharacterized protein PSANT_01522 [Moesziomyces antarcticus]
MWSDRDNSAATSRFLVGVQTSLSPRLKAPIGKEESSEAAGGLGSGESSLHTGPVYTDRRSGRRFPRNARRGSETIATAATTRARATRTFMSTVSQRFRLVSCGCAAIGRWWGEKASRGPAFLRTVYLLQGCSRRPSVREEHRKVRRDNVLKKVKKRDRNVDIEVNNGSDSNNGHVMSHDVNDRKSTADPAR